MISALLLGAIGIAYGLLANNPGEVYIGVCLIGLALLVFVEEHERRLVRRKNRASDSLSHLGKSRVGYEQRAKDAA